MTSTHTWTATWIEVGFFWPSSSVTTEMKTEQGFIVVPVEGLETHAQFFVVRVGADALHVVIGASAHSDRARVRAALHTRHPGATCSFIEDDRTGHARVTCEGGLSVDIAIATAVVRHSASWDESEVIVVTDGVVRHDVRVTYERGVFSGTASREA